MPFTSRQRDTLCLTAMLLCLNSAPVTGTPWGSASFGLDMSYLEWEHGSGLSWGFQAAFGPRLFGDVYLRARVTMPIPGFVVIGNQVAVGGELVCPVVGPDEGFAIETSLGASWCLQWPEHVIVVLADGEQSEPPEPQDYDSADGLRLDGLASIGWRYDALAIWLDMGLDWRRMDVLRFVDGEREEAEYDFLGPHLGLSADIRF